MNNIYEMIEEMRLQFGWDKSDNIEFLTNSILEEALELKIAMMQENKDNIAFELADILMYSLTLAKMLDLDVETIIKDKIEIVKQRDYE
jgi:NTP pyrophosphatase (non-canonical NTP hydrolase)